jgi:hypothetical protein
MSGFIVESSRFDLARKSPLKLVDLGHCDVLASRGLGRSRAAWARWSGSRHLRLWESPDRLLFIEGQPDRYPNENESIERWLEGRGGSFRGFQIELRPRQPARITAFVDPACTRPIFVLRERDRMCFADKLSTIVANTPGLECDWGALLETAVLSSLTSGGTTLRDVTALEPGECLTVSGVEVSGRRRNKFVLDRSARPDLSAAQRLGQALGNAVRETWNDPDACLLLSGGLDSRLLLALSPHAVPRTATLDLYPEESVVARHVAAARGAAFEQLPCPPEHYCTVMQHAYLVTGGMHQSSLVANLGLGTEWRRSGIPAIVHGFFHNTIFRGWTAERWQKYPDLDFALVPYLGRKAHYFDNFPLHRNVVEGVLNLLSGEGRDLLKRQLKILADRLEVVVVDGFDLTYERHVLKDLGRQVNIPIFLGWMEEIDVVSPVFHPESWNWYATTHPADRHRDNALRQLYPSLGYGLSEIPDINTGEKVRPLPKNRREAIQNQFWFPAALKLKRVLDRYRKPAQPKRTHEPLDYHSIYRQKPIEEALATGLEAVRGNALFDHGHLDAAVSQYRAGDNSQAEALWQIAIAGQWSRFVADRRVGGEAVRDALPSEDDRLLRLAAAISNPQ